MNIQIFGKNKCFDTKKAQRYFKERNIKFQFINLDEKEMSKKEFESVLRQVGIDSMIDPKAKDKELLTMLNYLSDKEDKVYLNQHILKTPIVRNGKWATVGYEPNIWKTWNFSAEICFNQCSKDSIGFRYGIAWSSFFMCILWLYKDTKKRFFTRIINCHFICSLCYFRNGRNLSDLSLKI